ncbi:MAG: hypothetical protein ABI468_00520 [Candidatus Nanopelagicales bacterium]
MSDRIGPDSTLGNSVQVRADVATLTQSDRQQLARWLADLNLPPKLTPQARQRRRTILLTATAAAIVLIPWTAFLAVTLPERHRAQEWRLTWVGLDIALVAAFAATAWFGWRRRHPVMTTLIVTATLLLCDAWFDVTLSWGGSEQVASIVAAVGVEVPLAILFLIVRHRLDREIIAQAWRDRGLPGDPPPLHRVPLQLREDRAETVPLG